jgi:hypothetical protein
MTQAKLCAAVSEILRCGCRGSFSGFDSQRWNGAPLSAFCAMMNDGMMWGMGIGHILVIVLVVLVIAALIKYVFFR